MAKTFDAPEKRRSKGSKNALDIVKSVEVKQHYCGGYVVVTKILHGQIFDFEQEIGRYRP